MKQNKRRPMISFEDIMTVCEEKQIGTFVRRCAESSVEEAKEAIKNHPGLELEVMQVKNYGVCIAIKPKGFKTTPGDVAAIHVKGYKSLKKIFRRSK
jgi:hypothetical protein